MSIFIRKTKIIERDKLIPNSHNTVKTTWDKINKESGRNKERSGIEALNFEGRKITDQRTVVETFNEYFVAITENVKWQSKNNLINDDKNSIDSHTHFMKKKFKMNLNQIWNINAQQQKNFKEFFNG